jgi:hypothetical protein
MRVSELFDLVCKFVWPHIKSAARKPNLYRLLDMSIPSSRMAQVTFHNNRNAEYARPDELELVLSTIQTMA